MILNLREEGALRCGCRSPESLERSHRREGGSCGTRQIRLCRNASVFKGFKDRCGFSPVEHAHAVDQTFERTTELAMNRHSQILRPRSAWTPTPVESISTIRVRSAPRDPRGGCRFRARTAMGQVRLSASASALQRQGLGSQARRFAGEAGSGGRDRRDVRSLRGFVAKRFVPLSPAVYALI